jgi:hypothetical protein
MVLLVVSWATKHFLSFFIDIIVGSKPWGYLITATWSGTLFKIAQHQW